MKKQARVLAIFVVAVLISFLTGAVEACVNTFNADGNLCIIGTPEFPGTSTQETGTPMELWAGVGNEGTGTLVGHITFDNESVIINLNDADNNSIPDMYPWVATAVHIHFDSDINNFPLTKMDNPIPGHFEFSSEDLEQFEYTVGIPDNETVIKVPVEFDSVGAIHIAVEKPGGVEGFGHYLDEALIQMSVEYPTIGDQSYMTLDIQESGFLDGIYESWCVDEDVEILENTSYDAKLFSSYEDLPAGLFEHPGNFDKVNYLLNNFEVGQMVTLTNPNCSFRTSCGSLPRQEPLTYGDIQRAIWILIDDGEELISGLGPWWQPRVDAILCDANANGGGFIPTCEEKTVFIVVPVDSEGEPDAQIAQLVAAQSQISTTEIPCETLDETAWGDGKHGANFLDAKQWATYFLYDETCVPE